MSLLKKLPLFLIDFVPPQNATQIHLVSHHIQVLIISIIIVICVISNPGSVCIGQTTEYYSFITMVSPYQTWACASWAPSRDGIWNYGPSDWWETRNLSWYGKLAREWVRQEERMWPGDLDPRPDLIQPGNTPPSPLLLHMMTGSDMAQSSLNTCTQHSTHRPTLSPV